MLIHMRYTKSHDCANVEKTIFWSCSLQFSKIAQCGDSSSPHFFAFLLIEITNDSSIKN